MQPFGASGWLDIDRATVVLPLDDERAPEAAKPVQTDGTVRVEPATLNARRESQARAEPCFKRPDTVARWG
jgi:hypothetical protein